jgi:AraC-like DNA-binding protein
MPGPLRETRLVELARAAPPAPRPRLQWLGFFETSARYVYRRHQHLDFELIIPTRGRYRCRIDDTELALAPGQALLVKPRDWHEDLLEAGVGYWALGFTLGDGSLRTVGGWFRDGIDPRAQVCSPPRRELEPLLERMRAETERGDAFSPLVQDAILAELAWRLARAFPTVSLAPSLRGTSSEAAFAARLERLFAARVDRRLGVGEMARALGMGRAALAAACRRHLGLTPAKAFARYRLDRAHALLTRTAMSVAEVSAHLGFENPFHFSRAFKRRWGRPPSTVARTRP